MLKKKSILIFAIVFISVFVFSACQSSQIDTSHKAYYRFKDDLGTEVILNKKPENVVSLFGSYAETWTLAGGELKGVTNDAKTERNMNLPENVKVIGTVKEPNIEKILALSPDFVLLSPDIESHKKISTTLKELNIPYAFFEVENFDDYLAMLKICTDITGESDLYKQNGTNIQGEIDKSLLKVDDQKKPTILFIRAFSTGAKAKTDDNMTGRMLADLGCDNIAARHKSLLDTLSIEEIISEDPDFIFVVTMGESSEKAVNTLKNGIQKNPAWSKLSAVKNSRYIVLPKELFQYKPNAKWGEAYEYLAEILYK